MAAGTDRDRLLEAIETLTAEMGEASGADDPPVTDGAWSVGEVIAGTLSEDEEALVRELGRCLARLAEASAARGDAKPAPANAVAGAIGGAQILISSELIAGRGDQLEAMLPGFVYMVTLPYLEQAEALALSRRTAELLDVPSGEP